MTETPPDGSRPSGLFAVDTSLRSQSFFLTLARVSHTLLAIAVPIVVVRALDQDEFGYYKQIALLTSTAVGLLTLGLPASLYYFVPRSPRSSQSLLVRSVALLLATGTAGGLLLWLGAPWLGERFSAPLSDYGLVLALLVAASVPESLVDVVAVVDRRARLSALVTVVLGVLRSALVVAVALVTRDLFLLLLALVAAGFTRFLAVVVYLAWRRGAHPLDREPFRTGAQLRYALPFFSATLIGMATNQLHAYYVAIQFSATQFAVYAVGTLSIPFVDKLTQSVAEVVVLDASGKFGSGRSDEIRSLWHRASYGIALVLVPTFVVLEFFAPDVISLIYGSGYREAAQVMRVYLLLILLWIPLSSAMLRASGNLRTMIAADAVALAGTVGVLVVAGPRFGVFGAVGSLVVGHLLFNVVAGWRAATQLGIGLGAFLPWRRIAQLFALSAAAAAGAALLTASLPSWLRALAGPGLGMGLVALGLWLTPLLPESERELVRQLLARLRAGARRPGAAP